jgi:predicted phage tail protein
MRPEPGLFQALSDTVSRAGDLVQLEVRVFKAELDEKLSQLKAGMALIISGAIFIAAALFLLLQAAVLALVQVGLSPAVATLLVAAAAIVIGVAFLLTGRKQMNSDALTPDRTIHELQRDTRLVKEKLS